MSQWCGSCSSRCPSGVGLAVVAPKDAGSTGVNPVYVGFVVAGPDDRDFAVVDPEGWCW